MSFERYIKEEKIVAREVDTTNAIHQLYLQYQNQLSERERFLVEGILAEKWTSILNKHQAIRMIAQEPLRTQSLIDFINHCNTIILTADPNLENNGVQNITQTLA